MVLACIFVLWTGAIIRQLPQGRLRGRFHATGPLMSPNACPVVVKTLDSYPLLWPHSALVALARAEAGQPFHQSIVPMVGQ